MKYTYADAMKAYLGIQQNNDGLRRAAYIIHCSLVNKKDRADINKLWPLPFDYEQQSLSTFERLKQRHLELKKQTPTNG